MNLPNLQFPPAKRTPILQGPDAYLKAVLDSKGGVLQVSHIGALTLVTTYRGLGHFECVLWSDVHYETSRKGECLAQASTMETANGFHHALAKRLWSAPWGRATRKRADWFTEEAMFLRDAIKRSAHVGIAPLGEVLKELRDHQEATTQLTLELAKEALQVGNPELSPEEISGRINAVWQEGMGLLELLLAADPIETEIGTKQKALDA